MPASIYTEKLVQPNEKMLTHDLAAAKKYFDKIGDFIEKELGDFRPEWKFYNQKSGWIMKMFTKDRNVLFVVPGQNSFWVAFTFGDKAADQILHSDLPKNIKDDLSAAKKYAEGRTIQVAVKSKKDLDNVLKMIHIKVEK